MAPQLIVINEKLSLSNSQTYKGDCKFYFHYNKKFSRWCYYQKTPELKAKYGLSSLRVNPMGSLSCKMKTEIIENLNLRNFCSTFQSKMNKIKKAVSKLSF